MSDYEDEKYIKQLESQLSESQARVKELEEAAIAYRDLTICYRVGKTPSEKLFKQLDKAKKALTPPPQSDEGK